jgi:hypothetical protein
LYKLNVLLFLGCTLHNGSNNFILYAFHKINNQKNKKSQLVQIMVQLVVPSRLKGGRGQQRWWQDWILTKEEVGKGLPESYLPMLDVS